MYNLNILRRNYNMLFVNYPKCSTCQKARKWLTEHHLEFEDRDIKGQNPDA